MPATEPDRTHASPSRAPGDVESAAGTVPIGVIGDAVLLATPEHPWPGA